MSSSLLFFSLGKREEGMAQAKHLMPVMAKNKIKCGCLDVIGHWSVH
jgi:hypothetical protein